MMPDQDPTRRPGRYLILNQLQALENLTQFRDALCPVHNEPPEHWLAVSHGMVHFLSASSDIDDTMCALPSLCASDMRMLMDELERFAKPNPTLDSILPGKGVIQHGRNGDR